MESILKKNNHKYIYYFKTVRILKPKWERKDAKTHGSFICFANHLKLGTQLFNSSGKHCTPKLRWYVGQEVFAHVAKQIDHSVTVRANQLNRVTFFHTSTVSKSSLTLRCLAWLCRRWSKDFNKSVSSLKACSKYCRSLGCLFNLKVKGLQSISKLFVPVDPPILVYLVSNHVIFQRRQ